MVHSEERLEEKQVCFKNKAGIQRLLTGPVSRRLQFHVTTVTTSGLLTNCVEHKEDLVSPTVSSSIST